MSMDGRRDYGQVWTPEDVADAMATWCARPGRLCVDPAAGSGRLLDAAARRTAVWGVELDDECPPHNHPLTRGDFLDSVILASFPPNCDWICNPPYIRHSLIDPAKKGALHTSTKKDGLELRGTVGLHAFFVHAIVRRLRNGDRAALLLPSDLFEGVSASGLLSWVVSQCSLVAVAMLEHASGVFGNLDTRGMLLLLEGRSKGIIHSPVVAWTSVGTLERPLLRKWIENGFTGEVMTTTKRTLEDLIRQPTSIRRACISCIPLGNLASVTRGIVAAHAPWALMNSAAARERGIPKSALRRIIRRSGDVSRNMPLTDEALDILDAEGIPTFLFSPSPEHLEYAGVRAWIQEGESAGLPLKPSLINRNPWWKAERRRTPPWLFSYFGGEFGRFVKNESNAAPLTGHLCVYPHSGHEEALERMLSHPYACENLRLVGKCYGKSIKVEPRALERLPLKF